MEGRKFENPGLSEEELEKLKKQREKMLAQQKQQQEELIQKQQEQINNQTEEIQNNKVEEISNEIEKIDEGPQYNESVLDFSLGTGVDNNSQDSIIENQITKESPEPNNEIEAQSSVNQNQFASENSEEIANDSNKKDQTNENLENDENIHNQELNSDQTQNYTNHPAESLNLENTTELENVNYTTDKPIDEDTKKEAFGQTMNNSPSPEEQTTEVRVESQQITEASSQNLEQSENNNNLEEVNEQNQNITNTTTQTSEVEKSSEKNNENLQSLGSLVQQKGESLYSTDEVIEDQGPQSDINPETGAYDIQPAQTQETEIAKNKIDETEKPKNEELPPLPTRKNESLRGNDNTNMNNESNALNEGIKEPLNSSVQNENSLDALRNLTSPQVENSTPVNQTESIPQSIENNKDEQPKLNKLETAPPPPPTTAVVPEKNKKEFSDRENPSVGSKGQNLNDNNSRGNKTMDEMLKKDQNQVSNNVLGCLLMLIPIFVTIIYIFLVYFTESEPPGAEFFRDFIDSIWPY